MQGNNPIAAYQEASLESAPPIKIVRLLYQSAIRRMEQARRMDPLEQAPQFNEVLAKADAIVTELRFSLDHSQSAELCQRLESLYLFVEDRIAAALGERRAEDLEAAVGVMRTLLEAWEQLEVEAARAA